MVSIATVLGLCSLLVVVVQQAGTFLRAINSDLGVALVASSATIIVSVISVLVAKWAERRSRAEEHQREKKVPIYEKIVTFVFRVAFAEKLHQEMPSEAEMMKFFADLTPELVSWSSPAVIKAFVKFRTGDGQGFDIMWRVEDLLKAIRSDLGHSDSRLVKGDLLRLFINDVDKYVGTSQRVSS